MLDNILGLIKNTVSSGILNNSSVPDDKKEQAVETTTQAMANGLKQNLNLGNVGSLMGLFGKGNNQAAAANPITSNLQNTVANSLVKEVGLSQTIATTIAATVVPMVMKSISGKVESNQPTDGGNGILEGLGKIFK